MIIYLYVIIIMAFTHQDTECMTLALKLSQFGRRAVGANPMVGCVITLDGKIIAQDYHRLYGEGHAEVNALEQINYKGENTKVYITLEPCSHYGKTAPCSEALIKAGVKKVFIAMLDPNPLVSGRGIKLLQDSDIEVEVGLLEKEATEINRGFIKRMQTGLPFVTSKIAMSLDGRTAMKNGDSKWITSEASRKEFQLLRS
jgi:diaminohydroxyphosphoribosylaminopyrimidine deaminase/5-amino-6-(5-phosphoribosylamino)uracil reductase